MGNREEGDSGAPVSGAGSGLLIVHQSAPGPVLYLILVVAWAGVILLIAWAGVHCIPS